MNIIFIHGTGGDPREAFFPWCRQELEKLGHQTFAPPSANAMEPDPQEWVEIIMDIYDPHAKTVFVGRSSGGNIIPYLLERDDVEAELALSLAAPINDLGWDNLQKLFAVTPDWEMAKASVKNYQHWYSDDDPHVPLSHGEELHELLGGELRVFKGYSHFYNEEFPELLELMEKTVASSSQD